MSIKVFFVTAFLALTGLAASIPIAAAQNFCETADFILILCNR